LDCATGSGQAAVILSKYFEKVIAIDASAEQLQHAFVTDGVEYKCLRAEDTHLPESSVDLITVAAGLHWFDIPEFYNECQRILKPGGAACCWTYSENTFHEPKPAEVVRKLWHETLVPYKHEKTKIVQEKYRSVSVDPLVDRQYEIVNFKWKTTVGRYVDYISTWSPVNTMRSTAGIDPIPQFRADMLAAFETDDLAHEVTVVMDIGLLMGRKANI
jgi:SAM-dependent methyltransferase